MQSEVRKQLSEDEYEIFGKLFRCSDTSILTQKLTDILKITLRKGEEKHAKNIANQIDDVFLTHLKKIEIEIDFYDSPESEGYENAKEINQQRIRSEKKFDKELRKFEKIKERCQRYQLNAKKIGYSIDSTPENRKKYPLYPPSSFLTEEDIKSLEKFLHWDVFLSHHDKKDQNVGNPYLYIDMASKIGAGGRDINAQKNNNALLKELAPILSETGLSVRKIAILVWAHQYYVSKGYYWNYEHRKNFFIPALSTLVKDVDKAIKSKD